MSAGQIDVERLKEAMEAANLDQSGLARLIDTTPGTVNQILTGRTKRSRYMPVIAQELNVSLNWLMKRSDDRDEPAAPRLSDDERRLLTNFRRLTGAQQLAVMQILDGMVPSSTLHSKQHTYRAQG